MKYINLYSTLNDYITDFCNIKDYPTLLNYVKDEDSMIGLSESKPTVMYKPKSSAAWFGDILCWNNDTNDWYIYLIHSRNNMDSDGNMLTDEFNTKIDFDDNLIPDSVCVIPACYTDDGKARWVALHDCLVYQNFPGYDNFGETIVDGYEQNDEYTLSNLFYGCYTKCMESGPTYNTFEPLNQEFNSEYYDILKSEVSYMYNYYAASLISFYTSEYTNDDTTQGPFYVIFDEFSSGETSPYYNSKSVYFTSDVILECCGETMAKFDGTNSTYNTNTYHIPYSTQKVERLANDYYFDNISISKFNEKTIGSNVSYIFEDPLHTTTYQRKKRLVFNADSKGINALTDLNGYENTLLMLKASKGINDLFFYPAYYASHPEETYINDNLHTFDHNPDHNPEGTWYLPAVGEILYLLSRFFSIQYSLCRIDGADYIYVGEFTTGININLLYDMERITGDTCVDGNFGYWTSTWFANNCLAWYIPGFYAIHCKAPEDSTGKNKLTNLNYKKRIRAFKKY